MSINLDDFGLLDDLSAPIKAAEVNVGRAYSLRPYQADALQSVRDGFDDDAVFHQLVCMATGCGKTVFFAALAQEEVAKGGRVLILAHTDELLEQAIEKIQKSTGIKAAKEKAGVYASRRDKIVVGSVQTLQRLRLSTWPKKHFSLIIVDEAHRSLAQSYQNVLTYFEARVVGVTATADRGDKKALGDFYQRVAFDYGLLRAVKDGWLVRPIVKTIPLPNAEAFDLNKVKSKQTADGNDFDRMEVATRISPYLDAIAAKIKEEAGDRKIISFLPSVETARMMSDAMKRVGIPSDFVTGECVDRKEKIARYKSGELQHISNMALLTEGFDHDAIDTLVILRPTKIRSLYAQMVGRGTRPLNAIVGQLAAAPDAASRAALIKNSAKPHVTILDFLWVYARHDLIKPASLVSTDPKLTAEMSGKDGDLMEVQAQAERDLLKKLEAEVKKNARKKSKVVDPLAIATELGDVELADYEPETARDAMPVSPRQAELLRNFGVGLERKNDDGTVTKLVTCFGHAHALISRILARQKAGLANIRQLHFFSKLGIDARNMTYEEARRLQKEKIAGWAAKRQAAKDAKRAVDEPELLLGEVAVAGGAEPPLDPHADLHAVDAAADGADGVRDEEVEAHVGGDQVAEGEKPDAVAEDRRDDVVSEIIAITGPRD